MIMIGGEGHNDNDMTSADPTNHGIAVFDMTKLAFKNSYQADAPVYEPPEMVQRYYSADRYVSNTSIPPPAPPAFLVLMAPWVAFQILTKKNGCALFYCSNNRYPSSWTSTEVKELFEGTPSSTIFNSSCITTASAHSCRATRLGLSNATIAGLVFGCIGVFLLILTATVCTFCVKRAKSPRDHDENGTAIISVDVQEVAAEQAPQEIMTERKDRAELSA